MFSQFSESRTNAYQITVKPKNEKIFLLDTDELKKRAVSGDSNAQLMLGITLRKGFNGCTINRAEGALWIERAKQDVNTPGGLSALGVCYLIAIGGIAIINMEKAKECYLLAANQGFVPAMTQLAITLRTEAITTTTSYTGQFYATHTHKNEPKLAEALKWLTQAAEEGYSDALNELGFCYDCGYGVSQNKNEAFRLYSLAANTGHAYARRAVGNFWLEGVGGVWKDTNQAKKWFKLAREQGIVEGTNKVSSDCWRMCFGGR